MFNENQKEYTVDMIKRYEKEANSADRKAFWQGIGVSACVVLIGAASFLSHNDIITQDIATGAQTVAGIIGASLFTETINNNNKRNLSQKHARELLYRSNIDKLEDPIEGKHIKR